MALKQRLLFLISALFLTLSFLLSCGKAPSQLHLKLSHGLDVVHPVHEAMMFMSRRLRELSGGAMTIDVYPSEQLGSERENIELIQFGSLDITKTSAAVLESFVPEVRVYSLPYLFRDQEHAWRVFLGPVGKEILQIGKSKGIMGLCYYDSGSRSFYTKDKPILTPDDLAGLKIRVQKSMMAVKTIQILGGSPTPIDWGELYTALQQGVVDGAENNPPSFYTSHHYEVCKYYYLDEHTTIPDVLLMSERAWSRLSEEQRRILQQAADESMHYQRKIWTQMVEESLAKVREAGVEVGYPDKKSFMDKVAPLYEEFAGTEIGRLAERIRRVE
ncbi:MAG: TRAP transporter substrate-binding protein [Candidatus Glassbacteria bacterium]|nr:TRAP transporter substrate-binding protein [Candidatus Glassbacteria bacterium]